MKVIGHDSESILIGMWEGGVLEYEINTGESKHYTTLNNNIYSLEVTDDGTIWAGSWGGGIWTKSSSGNITNITDKLSNGVIYTLFKDRSGLLWVGTNGGGAHTISPRKKDYRYIASSDTKEGALPTGKVSYIYRDIDKNLWISINGKGLYLYDEKDKIATHYNTIDLTIHHIINDKNGRLWVSSDSGLMLMNVKDNSYTLWEELYPELPLSHRIITHFYETTSNEIWISTYGEGINVVDIDNKLIKYFKSEKDNEDSLSDNIIYNVLERDNGSIWITTNHGLNRYNRESSSFKRYNRDRDSESSLSGDNTRFLYEDSSQNLWIATMNSGLNRYIDNSNTFEHYTTREGLSSNNIFSILEGKDNQIWISTSAGISMIHTTKKQIKTLNEDDGLHTIFFYKGSFKDVNGEMLFGGIHGITKISSFKQNSNNFPPPIIFTSVHIQHKEIKFKNEEVLNLRYDQNHIGFNFIGLDYETPKKITYKYKLEGFDNGWQSSGTRNYVNYTSLNSGDYMFKVKAINSDGIESISPITLSFSIKKPWFRTWFALTIYIIVLFSIIYLFIRWRYATILTLKNQELEKMNKQLEILTIKDPLTNTYNRPYFEKAYIKEFHRSRRISIPLAVIFIDIDNFKVLNDKYGIEIGNLALITVSNILLSTIKRSIDFISRFDGDEFIVILNNTNVDGTEQVIKRIFEEISNLNIKEFKEPLTVSIGVHVGIPDNHISSQFLLDQAEEALLKAKNRGKNRVEFSLNSI